MNRKALLSTCFVLTAALVVAIACTPTPAAKIETETPPQPAAPSPAAPAQSKTIPQPAAAAPVERKVCEEASDQEMAKAAFRDMIEGPNPDITVVEADGKVNVTLGKRGVGLAPNSVAIHALADNDACIHGFPRRIDFYRDGQMIGYADPKLGIKVLSQ